MNEITKPSDTDDGPLAVRPANWNPELSKEQKDYLESYFRAQKAGPIASIPVICNWNKCHVRDSCPLYQMHISPTPEGKPCLTGDSMVLMSDYSLKRLDSVIPGDIVISIDLSSHRMVPAKVVAHKCSGRKATYIIETRDGLSIRATENHLFWSASGYTHRRASGSKNKSIDVSSLPHQWLSIESGLSEPRTKIATVPTINSFGTSKLPNGLAELLGYHLGDGCFSSYQLTFSNTNRLYIDEYLSCAEKLGSTKSSVSFRERRNRLPSWEIRVQSNVSTDKKRVRDPVRDMFKTLGLANITGPNKRIPSIVFNLNKEQVGLLVNRFWAADGTISYKNNQSLAMTQESRGLLEDLQRLLSLNGIRSIIYPHIDKKLNWKMYIYGCTNIIQFFDLTGPILGKESASTALLEICKSKNDSHFYPIEGDVRWSYIKSITASTTEDVFDIQVENHENFVANGFLVHNCPIEINLIDRWVRDYANELEVMPENIIDLAILKEMVMWKILEKRAGEELAKEPRIIHESVIGIDDDGIPVTKDMMNPIIVMMEKAGKMQAKLRESLLATRESKDKANSRKQIDLSAVAEKVKAKIEAKKRALLGIPETIDVKPVAKEPERKVDPVITTPAELVVHENPFTIDNPFGVK